MTDKGETESATAKEEEEEDDERLKQLSSGNHHLLPIFEGADAQRSTKHSSETDGDKPIDSGRLSLVIDNYYLLISVQISGIIIFKGCVVDVSKLLQQIERSEKSRVHIEEKMVQLEKTLGMQSRFFQLFVLTSVSISAQSKESAKTASDNASKLTEQLKECKSKLSETEVSLQKAKVGVCIFDFVILPKIILIREFNSRKRVTATYQL